MSPYHSLMKRFQFSISAMLAATFLVAIALSLSLRGGALSEWSLPSVGIGAFLLSYWKSPKAGWRQVLRATGTTALIWGVLILCLYAWFLNREGDPSAVELARHAALVVLAAALAALGAACAVEAIRADVRFWRRGASRRRVVLALSLLVLVSLVGVAWTTLRPSYWEPATVTSAAGGFKGGFPYLPGIGERPELKYVRLVVPSADGRLVAAILNGQRRVLVFDSPSGEPVASFAAGSDEWFGDLTFHPDGSVLAAILCSRTAPSKLARWDLPGWTPREPIPLGHLLDADQRDERRCLALDRCLLVVAAHPLDPHTARVEVSTVQLLDERLARRPFASADVEIRALPNLYGLWSVAVRERWTVSPSGEWICGPGNCLFCFNGPPTKLRGAAIGFLPDTDYLAVHEGFTGLCWKREERRRVAPPFWDHLRVEDRSRVTIYDCRTQRVIARSRWFRHLREPCITPDGSQLVAQEGNSLLIWEFPES